MHAADDPVPPPRRAVPGQDGEADILEYGQPHLLYRVLDRSRSFMSRLIPPWWYWHPRAWVALRLATGLYLAGLGTLLLSHGYHGWAALALASAALHLSLGYLEINIARGAIHRSALRRT
jgi:hypothetical protein